MSIFPSEFQIGPIRVAPATVLAPMAGVTDTVFRRLIRNQGGCGLIMTEFTSSHGVVNSLKARKPTRTFRYLYFEPEEHPISAQLFGSDPQVMADAAQRLPGFRIRYRRYQLRLPGEQSGEVQRRLGTAARSAAGGGDPAESARGHFDSVHHEVPRRLERSANWSPCRWRQLAEDCGLQAVALHPRTREQGYSGKADWTRIAEVKSRGRTTSR